MKTIRFGLYGIVAAVVSLLLLTAGCAHEDTKKQTFVSCNPPKGVTLERAVAQARSDLQNPGCERYFEDYFKAMLDISQGDPSPDNKILFSRFLEWASTSGLITRVQAECYYNRYFNTTFMCLPDDYNICSACEKKAALMQELDDELAEKEQGLLRACADKETFYQAKREYDELKLNLEAVCTACERNS